MDNLKTITDIVHGILLTNPETRNSDNVLYVRVCEAVGKSNGIEVKGKPFTEIMLHVKEYNLPQYETVGRARRKLQSIYPSLAAVESVEVQRELNEEAFRKYARS